MNKKSVLITAMLVFVFASAGYGDPWPGSGDANDPYRIYSVRQMQAIGADPNYWGAHFKLMKDIDLSGNTYTTAIIAPDANPTESGFQGTKFTGVFDGNGHVISNFTIDTNGVNHMYLGLFGNIDSGGTKVCNLNMENVNITAGNHSGTIGGICGRNNLASIVNCSVTGTVSGGEYSAGVGGLIGHTTDGIISYSYFIGAVSGDNRVGGLVGFNEYGTISKCHSASAVYAGDYSDFLGGLVGRNYGTICDCYATGAVSGGDNSGGIGGLVGCNDDYYFSIISNCFATGMVSAGDNPTLLGGLAGRNKGVINNSYYVTGTIYGGLNSKYLGGLVGGNYEGTITNCHTTGDILVEGYSTKIGGLCGRNESGNILNCYSTVNVSGGDNSDFLGGLVGYNALMLGSSLNCTISNCYSAGRVAGESNVGGLIGYDYNLYSDYTACFWDVNVNPDVNGIGNIEDPNVVGLPTVLMQTESTYTDAGWDFVGETVNGPNDIWDICEGTNYPKLVWSIPAADFICPDGVNMLDFAILGDAWMSELGDLNWDPACDISEPNDNCIDALDLDIFVNNWLEGT